jgi:hypothetical protein
MRISRLKMFDAEYKKGKDIIKNLMLGSQAPKLDDQ